MAGIDLGYRPDPDWRRLAQSLRRDGEPDRVPLFELTIGFSIVEAVSGQRRPDGPEDRDFASWARFRTDFYYQAGYDFVGIGALLDFPKDSVQPAESSSVAMRNPIHDRASFDRYPWPEVGDAHLAGIEGCARILPEAMKIRPRCPGLLETAMKLMGFEGLCYVLVDDPELLSSVMTEIGQRLVKLADRYASHEDIEFITLGDDMGFRTGTMISPTALREYVFPWHRRIVRAIHGGGKIAVLHSDGNLESVMDDIIACGWDAKHSVEDAIMSVTEMKRRWGKRLALCGALDVDFLTRAAPAEVRERTHALISECAPGGGWALGSGNAVSNYVPVENYVAMLRAVRDWHSARPAGRHP